jgi:hypothetical protein
MSAPIPPSDPPSPAGISVVQILTPKISKLERQRRSKSTLQMFYQTIWRITTSLGNCMASGIKIPFQIPWTEFVNAGGNFQAALVLGYFLYIYGLQHKNRKYDV